MVDLYSTGTARTAALAFPTADTWIEEDRAIRLLGVAVCRQDLYLDIADTVTFMTERLETT